MVRSARVMVGLVVLATATGLGCGTRAGVTDAGVTDAGVTDAGVTDAGVTTRA